MVDAVNCWSDGCEWTQGGGVGGGVLSFHWCNLFLAVKLFQRGGGVIRHGPFHGGHVTVALTPRRPLSGRRHRLPASPSRPHRAHLVKTYVCHHRRSTGEKQKLSIYTSNGPVPVTQSPPLPFPSHPRK